MTDQTPEQPTPATPPAYYHPGYPNPQPTPRGNLFETAKFGTYGLIAIGVTLLFVILHIPGGFFVGVAGLVLAIISLSKKEKPKWPAITVIVISAIGLLGSLLLLIYAVFFISQLV